MTSPTPPAPLSTATLAGGCFWCIEAVFERLNGVTRVESGYTGGSVANPSYGAVCAGITGHAEAIRIDFDPRVVGYRTLLELFFAFHDPTTLNRQGPDVGTQYRSAIFVHSDTQRAVAQELIDGLEAEQVFPDPIVTTIESASAWYPAEAYHQEYYRRNPNQPYCAAMIGPKVAKLRARHAHLLRDPPAQSP